MIADPFNTTREGFPGLWGQAEISEYAEHVALQQPTRYPVRNGRRIPRRRVERWVKYKSFPQPVARLQMGPVYAIEEVAPWVEEHLAKPSTTTPIPAAVHDAIVADRGTMSEKAASSKHGVSSATVHRMWARAVREEGESE